MAGGPARWPRRRMTWPARCSGCRAGPGHRRPACRSPVRTAGRRPMPRDHPAQRVVRQESRAQFADSGALTTAPAGAPLSMPERRRERQDRPDDQYLAPQVEPCRPRVSATIGPGSARIRPAPWPRTRSGAAACPRCRVPWSAGRRAPRSGCRRCARAGSRYVIPVVTMPPDSAGAPPRCRSSRSRCRTGLTTGSIVFSSPPAWLLTRLRPPPNASMVAVPSPSSGRRACR